MEEEVAILRQIIAHFHHFSSPPFNVSSPRWYSLNVDEICMEDEHNNVMTTDEKSGKCKTRVHDIKASESKRARKEWCVKVIASEAMDEELWKEFPEDLLEAVLARLPIASFFRLRSVCRKWNSSVESSSFSQQCAQVAHTKPWLYTVSKENVSLYDSFMKKWRHPTKASPLPSSKLILVPAASAGGLVCLVDLSQTYSYVCNPLTQIWKELPARIFKIWSQVAIAMTVDGDSYKIIWVSEKEFEVYDSVKNKWRRGGDISPNIKLPLSLNLWSQAVCVKTRVYLLRLKPEGVVSYDTGSGRWKQLLIPNPPNSREPRLAEYRGRIMLVGLLTKNAATCVCVWELQKMTLLWKEVDRMPNAWCLEFYGKYVTMTCLGNTGLLVMSLRSSQLDRLVTYDVATREWSMPTLPWTQTHTHAIAFYPRLTSSP